MNKSRSLNKSRDSERNKTEGTVKRTNKSGSISRASLSDKITNTEQLKEINVISDSPSLLIMSSPGASVTTVSSDKQSIPRKIKRKKISETSIEGK